MLKTKNCRASSPSRVGYGERSKVTVLSALLVRRALGVALLLCAASPFVVAQTASKAPTASRTAPAASSTATAVFAGGCFWCVESDFDKVPGVLSTTSGYIGGRTQNPTYEQVSNTDTGHAESVRIEFDPGKVSYRELVDHLWYTIDPTTKDGQFCDIGHSYRSAIFPQNAEQLKAAQDSKAEIEKKKPFNAPIVTEIVPDQKFWPAEDYHQNYYQKNPVRYNFYRYRCGRDARLKELWGDQAAKH
ncbi:MAG: peptide-methionine (S)-S-oxide reductase MsrA [Rhodoferax sp.]|nr:peptide-methionine (S)-S-oxide reductase MsrA [Rhodoferax sp.]